jgi:hypothetical protein
VAHWGCQGTATPRPPASACGSTPAGWVSGWTSAGGRRCRLRAGDRDWVEGAGPPAAVLEAAPFELFRALSGRRSAGQVRALAWDGDPEPYLDVLSPYPMPRSPLLE